MELFEKAQLQLQRNAEVARKRYQPTSRRYLLRTLVKCGECGLGMQAAHQRSGMKQKYDYLYYDCSGHSPLTCGRVTKCTSRRVRAEQLDTLVWNSLSELLKIRRSCRSSTRRGHRPNSRISPRSRPGNPTACSDGSGSNDKVNGSLDAYQTEIITLSELHLRRQKLTTELQQLERELQQLTHSQQQTLHWQDVIAHVEHFRHLLGENLDRLSFADRQTVAQCLIKKVVVTGEQVDIYYVLPFDQAPQVYNSSDSQPEGTPGHFYRLRLADRQFVDVATCLL